MLDALLFFLSWCHVSFEQIQVVGVSTEDSFIVHDIASVSPIVFLLIHAVWISISEFVLAFDYLGMSSLKSVHGHYSKIC